MKILITGGNGFIGQKLIKSLGKNPQVSEITYTTHCTHEYGSDFYRQGNLLGNVCHADLTWEQDVKKIFEWHKPDIIFHLAGKATVVGDEKKIMDVNINGTHNLLKYAPKGCRFVLASSIIVHGDTGGTKVGDTTVPWAPTSIYGVSKLAAETLVRKYHMDGKIKGRILRLSATCGAGASHGVVKDLINKLKSDNEYLEILGNEPGSCKPYNHINDVIQAFRITGLDLYHRDELFTANVSSENEITIDKLADIIMEASCIKKPKKWIGQNWSNDNPWLGAFTDNLTYYGWNPDFPRSEDAIYGATKDILEVK